MELLKNKKNIYIATGIAVTIICIIVFFFIEKNNKTENTYLSNENIISVTDDNKKEDIKGLDIIVHIVGEVNNPGIIRIKEGSRIVDVVEKAGGFTEEADVDKVNLAYGVKDEQKIVIPNINKKDEETKIIDDSNSFVENFNDSSSTVVNINTATQSELESLTGIGPSMASKILDYRDKNGKFKTKEDIKNVPGIGNSKYEAIKDEICVK